MKNIILLTFSLLLLFSCKSSKDVLYLQGVDFFEEQDIEHVVKVPIQTNDLLSITVSSRNPELARPFNLVNPTNVTSTNTHLGYTVDENGDIDFPVLGKIKVAGLTRLDLQELIKNKLVETGLIKDPIVNIQFLNFKVYVMGEVSSPGSIQVSGDRITLLEAISMAGDLTIYGQRDRVMVIREQNGMRTILYNDLRSTDIFNSPCYYLQQNDIIYVEPNKTKAQTSNRADVNVWMSYTTFLLSISSILLVLFKN